MEMSHFKVGGILHTACKFFSEGRQLKTDFQKLSLLVGVLFVDMVLSGT